MKHSTREMLDQYKELTSLVTVLDAPSKGGNISVKFDDLIAIKSSGENMKSDHSISICFVSDGVSRTSYDFRKESFCANALKPSMEISMHLNLKSKFVFHYHPVYVLPYLCSNYEFAYGKSIDYANPGAELAAAVEGQTEEVLWLRNHGVVLQSDSTQRIKELYDKIKTDFFDSNSCRRSYTPDDVVDASNLELWLFRHYIELISQMNGLELNVLSSSTSWKLRTDLNEIYRMQK